MNARWFDRIIYGGAWKQSKRLGDVVFSLILLLHIFAFILINSYLYDCTRFIHSNPV